MTPSRGHGAIPAGETFPGRWAVPVVAAAATVALCLRLYGVDHGHPDFVTGDERAVIKDAVRFVAAGTLEPGHYNYPALFSYLFSAALTLAYYSGCLMDVGALAESVKLTHLFAPTQVALVGRMVSVLAGCGIVAVTYQLGKKAYGAQVGIGGAVFAAVSTGLVSQSRFALPDVSMALFAVFTCWLALVVLSEGRSWAYFGAGICAGLAISTKYNGGVVLLAVVAAHVLRYRGQYLSAFRDGRPAWAALGAAAGFFLGSPYWLVTPDRYYQALLSVASNLQFSLAPSNWPRLAMLESFVRAETGWAMLALAGCLFALFRRKAEDILLLAVVLPAFAYMGSWPKGGLHYTLYLFPLLGVLAARVAFDITHSRSVPERFRPCAFACLLSLLSAPQMLADVDAGHTLSQGDLRSEAARWIETNIPDGAVIGVYRIDYSPPLKGDIQRHFLRQQIAANRNSPELLSRLVALDRQTPIYTQLTLEYFLEEPLVPEEYRAVADLRDPKTLETFRRRWMDYDELRSWEVEYVVLPSDGYARFFENQPPPVGTVAHYYFTRSRDYIRQFLDPENSRFEVVEVFERGRGDRVSTISIIKVT